MVEIYEGYLNYEDVFDPKANESKYGRQYIHGQYCKVGFMWPRYNQPLLQGKGIMFDLRYTELTEQFGNWTLVPPSEGGESQYSETLSVTVPDVCDNFTDFLSNKIE